MASTLTIANAASLSGALDTGNVTSTGIISGIVMPSAWTAASITFQASHDGTTYQNLFDDAGNEVTITSPDASRNITFDRDVQANLQGWRWLKLRSGTSGTPVNQGAERILTLVIK